MYCIQIEINTNVHPSCKCDCSNDFLARHFSTRPCHCDGCSNRFHFSFFLWVTYLAVYLFLMLFKSQTWLNLFSAA